MGATRDSSTMSRRLMNFMGLRRSRSIGGDGSSRKGRRLTTDLEREESSVRDSSTHSALFDLELSHKGTTSAERDALLARLQEGDISEHGDPSVHLGGTVQRVVYLGRPLMDFELDLLQDLKSVRELCTEPTGLVLGKVVAQLDAMGYAVELRKNNPTDPAYKHNVDKGCLEKLRHTYIVCQGLKDGSVQHTCIVDPRFREQFQVGHPTPAYTSLLKAVPLEFVGSPLRLQALVNLLCGEIATVYSSQDLPLPPWRKVNAVLSKWFSPADMAVGAAVAAGIVPLAAAAEDSTGEALAAAPGQMPGPRQRARWQPRGSGHPPAGQEQDHPQRQQHAQRGYLGPTSQEGPLSYPLPQPQPYPLTQAQARQSEGHPGQLGHAEQAQAPPQPQVGALGLPPGAPTLLATLRAQQAHHAAGAGEAGPAGPAQAMHFFEALSLHRDSLRRQQEQQQQRQQQQQQGPGQELQRQVMKPARQQEEQGEGAPVVEEKQHGGRAYAATLAQAHAQPSSPRQQPPQDFVLQASPLLGQGHHPHQFEDRSNKPRRRARGAQQQQQQQALDGAPVFSTSRVARNADGAQLDAGSWTDLSTILETRSAQSSPAQETPRDTPIGSQAGAAAAFAAVSSTSKASTSSGWRGSGASSAAVYPAMPVAAYAGCGVGPPLPGAQWAAGGGDPPCGHASSSGEGSKRGGTRVVSLLARSLKSMGQKQTWTSLLPGVNSVRRQGSSSSREGSMRGGGGSGHGALGADRSWRGLFGDTSVRGGSAAAAAAEAAAAGAAGGGRGGSGAATAGEGYPGGPGRLPGMAAHSGDGVESDYVKQGLARPPAGPRPAAGL